MATGHFDRAALRQALGGACLGGVSRKDCGTRPVAARVREAGAEQGGGGVFRPVAAVHAVDTRRREIIAAVRAAVATGIPLDELTSLRDLLRADHVEILIEHYWQKNEKAFLHVQARGRLHHAQGGSAITSWSGECSGIAAAHPRNFYVGLEALRLCPSVRWYGLTRPVQEVPRKKNHA